MELLVVEIINPKAKKLLKEYESLGLIKTHGLSSLAEQLNLVDKAAEESFFNDIDNEEFGPADRDSLFEDAARVVVIAQQGSTSLIQRKLKLGYNRAGRIIDQLEHEGIVGPFEGDKARRVLIPDEYSLEQKLKELDG